MTARQFSRIMRSVLLADRMKEKRSALAANARPPVPCTMTTTLVKITKASHSGPATTSIAYVRTYNSHSYVQHGITQTDVEEGSRD